MNKPLLKRSYLCAHSKHEHALTGTWWTPNRKKPSSWGTKSSTPTRCGISQKPVKVCSDYINTWLKIKQEASGWPIWVGDDETKRQEYIRECYEHEGIQLEYDKIEYNPGSARSDQNDAQFHVGQVWATSEQNPSQRILRPPSLPPFPEYRHPGCSSRVCHQRTNGGSPLSTSTRRHAVSPNLNVFVASFTTCWTCHRLDEAIQLQGERVLFFDTDSVIYLEELGQPNPPLGDYLGEFTSELDADDYIVEFVLGGPKNYGYKTKNGKVECKVRGFRLNSEGKTQLSYDVMRQDVFDEIQRPQKEPRQTQVVKTHQIVRDAKTYDLYTFPSVTNWCMTRGSSIPTCPYGYQEAA